MTKKNIQVLVTLGIVSASVFVVIMIVLTQHNTPVPVATNQAGTPTVTRTPLITTTPSISAINSPTPTEHSTFKNGTYNSTVTYEFPHGGHSIVKVTAIIQNDIVTSVSDEYTPGDDESAQYMNWFDQAYKEGVVGKKINDIALSRVGGASLTTVAFMEALTNIASEAHP